mmetsp:Transcript_35175/g.74856  ORF Transcript_35175/g.74856 Transcript_35175/m.74856 type:complete len:258 (+) Transcript_35175:122-895(+)
MGTAITKLVFQPPNLRYNRDSNLIWLTTAEGEVIPSFIIDKEYKYTLLASHGNAEDLADVVGCFRELSQVLQVNIFAYEYTGYGMSTGEANELAVYADIEAAFKYLRDVVGVPWQQIILYGRSLGTGPSVYLSSKTAVRGMVLQSPFLSILRIAMNTRYTMPGDYFTNIDRINDVRCPIFIVHGTADEITPFAHAQELVENFREGAYYEPYWVENGPHNDLEHLAPNFYDNFTKFLRHLDCTPISEELLKLGDGADL